MFLAQSFPTPMEEPKKVLRAQYLGSTEVQFAVGMTVLNDAIEKVAAEKAPDNWLHVNVSISPSVIAIRSAGVSSQFHKNEKKTIDFSIKIIKYILFFVGR